MDPKVIIIDGKTYHSVVEMPPDIRQRYELAVRLLGYVDEENAPDTFESKDVLADLNRNNIPDMLENIVAANAIVNGMKIVIDGRELNGIENLPPRARARYDEVMRELDTNRNGIPDFVERMIKLPNQPANISTTDDTETARRSSSFDYAASARTSLDRPLPASPTVMPDTSNGWPLALAGLFLLLLCVAGAGSVWYFFLR